MEDINKKIVYDNYENGWNGRMKKGELPEIQQKITYPHPNIPGKMTSQNYIEYDDIAVVVLVRKCKNGEFQFGLVEKEAPAFIYDENDEKTAKGYNGIFLEANSFAFPDKNQEPENISLWLDDQIWSIGLEMEGMAELDSSKTAICQSFTNQNARFYVAGVKEGISTETIHWFPISSLESFLDIQRQGGKDNLHSSIQTLYPLELLRNKYIEQIKNIKPTKFELKEQLPQLELVSKRIVNSGFRFSIVEVEYLDINKQKQIATYLTSRSNAANTILMTKDNKTMFLSPQQRSPYLETNGIKIEVAGGLTEGKTYEETAMAELAEEQGFYTEGIKKFTGPLVATTLNSEISKAYEAEYENGIEGKQKLDEQEKIGEKIPVNFENLRKNIKNDKLPLTTKYYIMLKSRDIERERKIGKKDNLKEKNHGMDE